MGTSIWRALVAAAALVVSAACHTTTSTPPPASAAAPVTIVPPVKPSIAGARNPAVTPQTLAQTICKPGWTKTVRPPLSWTAPLKRKLLREQHLPGVVADYELDHLISLELGGAPRDLANLWLEPYEAHGHRFAPSGLGSESKDVVENVLKHDVCIGKIDLGEAQRRIATDWTVALAGL